MARAHLPAGSWYAMLGALKRCIATSMHATPTASRNPNRLYNRQPEPIEVTAMVSAGTSCIDVAMPGLSYSTDRILGWSHITCLLPYFTTVLCVQEIDITHL